MDPGQVFPSEVKEKRWMRQMIRNYTAGPGIHPVVYQVPQSLRHTKSEAYTPQKVGLGPYHHFRPEVQQMQSQKIVDVKDYLKVNKLQESIELVTKALVERDEQFQSIIPMLYDRNLDLDGTTFAWIVAIDGIYLLQFFNEESKWQDQPLVADIMMLENQIPLVLLDRVRRTLSCSFDEADIELFDQFYRFCGQQSPLKLSDRADQKSEAFDKHVLHFMYKLIVNNYEEGEGRREGGSCERTDGETEQRLPNMIEIAHGLISKVRDTFNEIVDSVTSGIQAAKAQGLKIPEEVEKIFKLLQQLKKVSDVYNKREKNDDNRLADKIEVPSVSKLHYVGKFKFSVTNGGIRNIRLDGSTIYLPEIRLGENTEVVLRNLVAYEAAAKPKHTLELSDYVDLMCGIIHTEIDVKLLQDFGIIKGNLEKEEIYRIFNCFNKSTERSNEKSELKMFVREVNKKFNNLPIVKAYNCIDKSLQSLITLFPILVLIFLALQAFCEFNGSSSGRFRYAAVPAASSVIDGSSFGLDAEAKLMQPRKVLRKTG